MIETYRRPWRLLAAAVLAGSVGAAVSLAAGERVIFSDSKEPSVVSTVGRSAGRSAPLGGLLERDSSLSGVAAAPFAPYSGNTSKALTPRQRDLLDRRLNWIERAGEGLTLDEKSANRAMGVREFSLDKTEKKSKGELERYMEQVEQKETKDLDKANADREGRGKGSPREGTSGQGKDGGTSGGKSEDSKNASGLTLTRDPTEGKLKELAAPDSILRKGFDPTRDSVRDVAKFDKGVMSLKSEARSQAAAQLEKQTRRDDFQRLLDKGPLSGPVANPLSGALDPVNILPDLTRRELNPVVGSVANQATTTLRPQFSDSLRPLTASPVLNRPSVLDAPSLKGTLPANLLPSLPAAAQPKKFQLSPTVLEAPRRTF